MGSVRTGIQPQISAEENQACHYTHDKAIDSTYAPSAPPGLAAVSWGFNRMDVFGEDQDSGDVSHKYWDGYQWGPSAEELEDLGGPSDARGPPGAVSRNASLIEYVQLSIRAFAFCWLRFPNV